jgi:hypothetical protein
MGYQVNRYLTYDFRKENHFCSAAMGGHQSPIMLASDLLMAPLVSTVPSYPPRLHPIGQADQLQACLPIPPAVSIP